jgi:hypothetical protein
MTWTVAWSDVCEADVRRIPWRTAARTCGAVLEFAENGSGIVERTMTGDPMQLRVRVRGAAALIHLDAESRTVFVWRIYATT